MPDATDLAGFAGAPFTDDEVDIAIATVQSAAGWHIAPVESQTVALNVGCWESILRLPTLRLVSVDEIRDASTAAVIDSTTYRVLTTAVLKLNGYWPSGVERVEVDFTHGYDDWPLDLYATIAETAFTSRRGGQTVRTQIAGPFRVDYVDTATVATSGALDRYLVGQPGMA